MFHSERFHAWGSSYVIVQAHDFRRSRHAVDASLERVPAAEARWVLAKLVRSEPRLFAKLYEALTGMRLPASGLLNLGTIGNPDAFQGRIVGAFGVDSSGAGAATADCARFLLLRRRREMHAGALRPDSPEGRRIGDALAKLGRRPLDHQGETYILLRAGAPEQPLANRDSYETLSETELFSILGAWLASPGYDAQRTAALEELLAAAEAQRKRTGSTELLLLRRQRYYARMTEDNGSAISPSQMRKALERHWVEVATVDSDDKPVAGVALEIQLADGSLRNLSSNADGFARLEPVPAGKVVIRLPKLDGSGWRAAGAKPSGKAAPDRSHTVKQGECLSRIALKYGFPDWKPVWDYGKNAALKQKRKSAHVLYPGDVLVVPGLKVHEIERATDASHRIQLNTENSTVELAISFKDSDGEALKGAYELRWGDGTAPKLSGSLDGSGGLKEQIPIQVKEVEVLLVDTDQRYLLATSHLDPLEDESGVFLQSGVASRLNALGYLHTAPEQVTPELLRDAVLHFQREAMQQEEPSGELDAATCQKLEELYGT